MRRESITPEQEQELENVKEQYADERRYLKSMLLLWLFFRVLYTIMEIILDGMYVTEALIAIISTILGLGLTVGFAYAIYEGYKWVALIPLAGGLYSLGSFISNMTYTYFPTVSNIIKAYIVIFTVAVIAQIVTMIFVFVSKRLAPYFQAMKNVRNG